MPADIIEDIRARQRSLPPAPRAREPELHRPEMLYIGCIDARLDPIVDIGIPKGKALIYRNIAALVRPESGKAADMADIMDGVRSLGGGEIPESISIGAALEFFILHIPHAPGMMRHIVVSGHTDCGGIRACLNRTGEEDGRYLPRYLAVLEDVREHVAGQAGMTENQRLLTLEEAAVRQSVANLMSYEVVREAVEADTLQLHGWVIDTATQRITGLSRETGAFEAL